MSPKNESSYFPFFRISDQLQLRLTDTALSSDLFPDDYQNVAGVTASLGDANSLRPVAWMSLEAITEGTYSQPCDVVSDVYKLPNCNFILSYCISCFWSDLFFKIAFLFSF